MKNKKLFLVLGVIVAILVLSASAFVLMRGGSEEVAGTDKKKTKILEPKNIIDVAERPYVKLLPTSDGHYIDIEIIEVKKKASEVEIALEYQAGTLLQGFEDIFSLDSLPLSNRKLFGSKSAGGAVTYHEDIKGGSLQLRFLGPENYVLKQDWRYFDNSDDLTELSSKDAKFQISSKDLKSNKKIVIYNTPGYPEGLKGELASEAYSLTSSSNLDGKVDVTIRANEEGSLKLMGYDGKEWQELDATIDGKTVTAEGAPLMELYLLTK